MCWVSCACFQMAAVHAVLTPQVVQRVEVQRAQVAAAGPIQDGDRLQLAVQPAHVGQELARLHQALAPERVQIAEGVALFLRRPVRHEPVLVVDLPAGALERPDRFPIGPVADPHHEAGRRVAFQIQEVVRARLDRAHDVQDPVGGGGLAVFFAHVQPLEPDLVVADGITQHPATPGQAHELAVHAVLGQIGLVGAGIHGPAGRILEVLVQLQELAGLGQIGQREEAQAAAPTGDHVRELILRPQELQSLVGAHALGKGGDARAEAEVLFDPLRGFGDVLGLEVAVHRAVSVEPDGGRLARSGTLPLAFGEQQRGAGESQYGKNRHETFPGHSVPPWRDAPCRTLGVS